MSIDQDPAAAANNEPEMSKDIEEMLKDVVACVNDPYFAGPVSDRMAVIQQVIAEDELRRQLLTELAEMLDQVDWLGASMTVTGKLRPAGYMNQPIPLWNTLVELYPHGSDARGEFIELVEAPLIMACPTVDQYMPPASDRRAVYSVYAPEELADLNDDEREEMIESPGTFILHPDEIGYVRFAVSSPEASKARLKTQYPELYEEILGLTPDTGSRRKVLIKLLRELRLDKAEAESNPQLEQDVERLIYDRSKVEGKQYAIWIDGRAATIDNEQDGVEYDTNQSPKHRDDPLVGEIVRFTFTERSSHDKYLYPGVVVAEPTGDGKYAAYIVGGEEIDDVQRYHPFARRTGKIATLEFDSPYAIAQFFAAPDHVDKSPIEELDDDLGLRECGEYLVLPLTDDCRSILREFSERKQAVRDFHNRSLTASDRKKISAYLHEYATASIPEFELGSTMITAPGITYFTYNFATGKPEMACLPDGDVIIGGYETVLVDSYHPLRKDHYTEKSVNGPCILLTGAKIYDTIDHHIEDIPDAETGQVLIPIENVGTETVIGRGWRRDSMNA